MKIKPEQYAQILLEATTGKNVKEVAANFWQLLVKNKQYKDLEKILDLAELEMAKKEGKVLAKVYSESPLTPEQEKEISEKLNNHYSSSPREARVEKSSSSRLRSNNNVVIKNIIKENWGGITVEAEGKVLDLSTLGKVEKLKKALK